MGNPCLSFPPVILKMYPLNSSPIVSPGTSCPIYVITVLPWDYSFVHKRTQTTFVFDFNQLLTAIGRICNLQQCQLFAYTGTYIELHPARREGGGAAVEGEVVMLISVEYLLVVFATAVTVTLK
jgi:hypothetical protein